MPLDESTELAIGRAAEELSKTDYGALSKANVMEIIRKQFMVDGAEITARRIMECESRMDLIRSYCADRPGEMLYLAKSFLNLKKHQ